MFSALAGMIMAAKVHMTQMTYPVKKKKDRAVAECIYENKVDKLDVTEKYKKSKLPESGYMTVEEYEVKSRPQSRHDISAKILTEAEMPKDKNMVYVPQYEFKLVKYNDPVGSPELTLPRKLNFDRQINAQGIVSGDFTKMVYPAVYYYAQSDCTSCDLYLIKLSGSMSSLEKVKNANIVNREPKPLISTDKDIDTKFIFRTLTPIDFSSDNSKLIVKEKVGHRHDGIWKTELWIYDFDNNEAKKLTEIREAIAHYWLNKSGIYLDQKRWDIYPLGFDLNDEERIVVSAYAYTGDVPLFLGLWSIDINGENTKLESLENVGHPISVVGYRLEREDVVIPRSQLDFDAKQNSKITKEQKKKENKEKKLENQIKKTEYKRKIHQMDMETMMKIKQREAELKAQPKNKDGYTGD